MRKLILFTFLLLSSSLSAQLSISGTVKDSKTEETLIGASILDAQGNGVITNENGYYTIEIQEDGFPIKVTYIGYQPYIITTPKEFKDDNFVFNIKLIRQPSVLDLVVVSGSRYEKKIEDEPISLEIISAEFINNNNVTSLADAMNYVPGVVMMDDQVNIRSSGYSYGAGSRVGLLIDGQPMLGPLESEVLWGFIPIENIEQVEVMKGASSVLYGSAAMNGVINVITAKPTAKPRTSITLYGGLQDNPPTAYRQWWQDTIRPQTTGIFVSHRQRIGKLDLVLGGNAHRQIYHIAHLNNSRYRFNINTEYHLTDKISFGINANAMYNEDIPYLIFLDADTNALRSIAKDNLTRVYSYAIDPHLTIYNDNGGKHIVKSRFLNGTLRRPKSPTDAPGYVGSLMYQYQQNINDKTLLTGGLSGQIIKAEDPRDETDTTENPQLGLGQMYAAFGQLDQKLFNDKVNLIVGLRAENVRIGDEFNKWLPITRFSVNYKATPRHIIRGNFGQGYRIPSLIERYIEMPLIEFDSPFPDVNSINLIPNPGLLPEIGWSGEIGYKYLLNVGNWRGYLDAALFQADYKEMVEFLFEFHKDLDRPWNLLDVLNEPNLLGFKMVNINHGRIGGLELSANMNGNLGNIPVKIWGGYTYTYAANMDTIQHYGMNYYKNALQAFDGVDSITRKTLLPYSNLHNGRLNIEFYMGKLTLGASANFYGYVPRIEPVFEDDSRWAPFILFLNNGPLVPGYQDFLDGQDGGNWVFDIRANYKITAKHRVHLIVNNILNREYAVRPGRMNPLRSFNVKYEVIF